MHCFWQTSVCLPQCILLLGTGLLGFVRLVIQTCCVKTASYDCCQLSIRQTLEPFPRQHWGNFWETGCSAYGLSRALKYHPGSWLESKNLPKYMTGSPLLPLKGWKGWNGSEEDRAGTTLLSNRLICSSLPWWSIHALATGLENWNNDNNAKKKNYALIYQVVNYPGCFTIIQSPKRTIYSNMNADYVDRTKRRANVGI